jgi:hypothetical protein
MAIARISAVGGSLLVAAGVIGLVLLGGYDLRARGAAHGYRRWSYATFWTPA